LACILAMDLWQIGYRGIEFPQGDDEVLLTRVVFQLSEHERSVHSALLDRSSETKDLIPVRTNLRDGLCLRRRLRAEDAGETFAVLKEDQHPQRAGHQGRTNTGP